MLKLNNTVKPLKKQIPAVFNFKKVPTIDMEKSITLNYEYDIDQNKKLENLQQLF